jgi:peroxiredoxin
MGWGRVRFLVGLLAGVILSSLCAAAQHSAIDLKGQTVDPFAASHGKVVVLVFLRRDCPVSGRYAPTIQEIGNRYSDRASFWLVYPDKSETPGAIRKSVAEYGYAFPVLRDPEHALAKLAHVQITPEAAVFDRDGKLTYDGRIDDRYIDLSRARPAPTTHELEDAIRAALAGQAVARNEVRGVGCYIADLQ